MPEVQVTYLQINPVGSLTREPTLFNSKLNGGCVNPEPFLVQRSISYHVHKVVAGSGVPP